MNQEFYTGVYKRIKAQLKTQFESQVKKNPDLNMVEHIDDFLRILYSMRDSCYQSEDTGKTLRNYFKKDLIQSFYYAKQIKRYSQNFIQNFIERDLIDIRDKHLDRISKGIDPYEYFWDIDFVKNSNSKEIIELCAKYMAIKNYTEELDKQKVETINEKQKKEKGLHSSKPIKQMQWLGDPKALAELFIELKRKGWIENFEFDTIKACFTKSHSIEDYLRPFKKNGQPTYSKTFTKKYKTIVSFDTIEQNYQDDSET